MTSASPGSSPRPEGRPSSGSPPDDRVVASPDGADLAPEGEPRELAKTDEMIFLGKEEGGFVSVQHPRGAGWVKKILVRKP